MGLQQVWLFSNKDAPTRETLSIEDSGLTVGDKHINSSTGRHVPSLQAALHIDYTLAQTCALQFWIRAQQDRATAMDDYVALCKRGGEAPFQQLVKGANLISPFEQGCLEGVVKQSRVTLGL